MASQEFTCSFAGLRPYKLPELLNYPKLMQRLENEIRASISAGYSIFQSGMAMGFDIVAAEVVHKLKQEFPHIRLHCYLPCETQANNWPEDWRERYFNLCAEADEVYCLQAVYTNGCMHQRNRAMVDCSSRLIAIYDGVTTGGTAFTIRYARENSLNVIIINPLDFQKLQG